MFFLLASVASIEAVAVLVASIEAVAVLVASVASVAPGASIASQK